MDERELMARKLNWNLVFLFLIFEGKNTENFLQTVSALVRRDLVYIVCCYVVLDWSGAVRSCCKGV